MEAQRTEVRKAGGSLSIAHFRWLAARELSLPIIRYFREDRSTRMRRQWECKLIHLPERKPLGDIHHNLKRHVLFGQQVYSLAVTQDRYPHAVQNWHLNKQGCAALVWANPVKVQQPEFLHKQTGVQGGFIRQFKKLAPDVLMWRDHLSVWWNQSRTV